MFQFSNYSKNATERTVKQIYGHWGLTEPQIPSGPTYRRSARNPNRTSIRVLKLIVEWFRGRILTRNLIPHQTGIIRRLGKSLKDKNCMHCCCKVFSITLLHQLTYSLLLVLFCRAGNYTLWWLVGLLKNLMITTWNKILVIPNNHQIIKWWWFTTMC